MTRTAAEGTGRVATATQAVIPPPEPAYPLCSLCHQETSHDGDNLFCDHCRIGWLYDNEPGFRLDDNLPQCSEETEPYATDQRFSDIANYRYRCVLNSGHGGRCRGGRIDQPHRARYAHEWFAGVS